MIIKRISNFRRFACVGLAAAALVTSSSVRGEEERPQLSAKVSEQLQGLRPMEEAKNYAGMLALVDKLLTTVPENSYDSAFLLDRKARIFLGLEQYSKAIEPWEKAVQIAEPRKFFEPRMLADVDRLLATLIFMNAQTTKDKQVQRQLVLHSASYLKKYLDLSPKPDTEAQMLYAQILYAQATADERNVDQGMLQQARQVVEKAFAAHIRPTERMYRLLLVILSQENDMARSADVMELMVKQNPNNKDLWSPLFGTYVNLAASAKTEKQAREFYIRAINTIEHAQSLGFMNSPRDNFNLVSLYLNAGQFSKATELLHEGMQKGTIESTLNNWKILGAYYQQAHKEFQAISALEEAAKLFPNDGALEIQIGQIYYQLNKIKEARDHYARAVAKGNLGEKPYLAYLYLSYTSFEVGDLDGAIAAIDAAAEFPDGGKDSQVKNLKEALKATKLEREQAKQREAAPKKL